MKKYSISSYFVWDYLRNKGDVKTLLSSFPSEFEPWIKKQIIQIKYNFFSLYNFCVDVEESIRFNNFENYPITKKVLANRLDMYYEKYLHSIIFAIYDKNHSKAEKLVWNTIKPKFEKFTIKKDLDEKT